MSRILSLLVLIATILFTLNSESLVFTNILIFLMVFYAVYEISYHIYSVLIDIFQLADAKVEKYEGTNYLASIFALLTTMMIIEQLRPLLPTIIKFLDHIK